MLLFSHILVYVCPNWYPNFNEKVKKKIQIMQNRCILFCLKFEKMHDISEKEFRLVNWLATSKRIDQYINTISYNFVNHTCLYLNDLFEFAPYCRIGSRNNFSKLKNLFCKSIYFEFGKITISCIGPSLWNSLSDSIKKVHGLNNFKHNVKKHYILPQLWKYLIIFTDSWKSY